MNQGRSLQIRVKLEGGRSAVPRGVSKPISADRPESGVSNEGGEGRRLNFRRPSPNLKGILKGQFTVC